MIRWCFMQEKYCSMCHEFKSISEYFKNRARKDGVSVYCKPCEKKKVQNRKEAVNAYNREWRKTHSDQVKLADAERRKSPEYKIHQQEYGKQYRKTHPIKADVMQRNAMKLKEMRKIDASRFKAYDKNNYNRNKRGKPIFIEKCKLKNHKHYSENKEYYIIKSHHRYARKMNAQGSHSVKEWSTLKAQFDNRCVRCLRLIQLTRDHVIPLSKGGSDYISNIQPLCKSCNSHKMTETKDYRPIARIAIAYIRLNEVFHSSPVASQ